MTQPVPPLSATSSDTTFDVEAARVVLASRLDLDVTNVELHADASHVTVTGTVPLRRMVHQIQLILEAQAGVQAVQMDLDVVTRDVADEERQRGYQQDATGMIEDDRDRPTGHEI